MARPPGVAVPAWIAPLPGEELPEQFAEPYEKEGFICRKGFVDRLRNLTSMRQTLVLLWVAERWEEGLALLKEFPDETRQNVVLVGRSPLQDIGPRVRTEGGLSWTTHPVPSWLPGLFMDAVLRREPTGGSEVMGLLRALQEDSAEEPRVVLRQLVEVAARMLGAGLGWAMMEEQEKFLPLELDEEGRVVPRSPPPDKPGLPEGLCAAAVRFRQVVVVPDLSASVLMRPRSDGPTVAASLAIPIRARRELYNSLYGQGVREAVLCLGWAQPRLPTAPELRLLEALSTLGTLALSRLAERVLLSSSHVQGIVSLDTLLWPPAPRKNPVEEAAPMERLEAFVQERLGRHTWFGDLLEIQVRTSPWSRPSPRAMPRWIPWGVDERNPGPVPEDLEERPSEEVFAWSDGFGLWLPLGPPQRPRGLLFALFETRNGALMARDDMRSLAADLDLGTRLLRGSTDSAALVRISGELANTPDPERARDRVLGILQEQLGADGVKVGLLRPGNKGIVLTQVLRTADGVQEGERLKVEAERGLPEWVLSRADWLMVERLGPVAERGVQPERCLSGKHGEVFVRTLAPAEAILAPQPGEQSLIWVPMYSHQELSGVLGVWRTEGRPFDVDLDVRSLLSFAPYVAAASERMLQMEKKREEFQAIATLARRLDLVEGVPEGEQVTVGAVGSLAEAAAALGLWRDLGGRLHVGGIWAASEMVANALKFAVADLRLDDGPDPQLWDQRVRLALEPLVARVSGSPGRLCYRSLLLPEEKGAGNQKPWPPEAVVLLDAEDTYRPYRAFAREIPDLAAATFLPYARALLAQHVRTSASRVGEKLSGLQAEEGLASPEQVLRKAASMLKAATGADAVLIYTGDNARMSLARSEPFLGEKLRDLRIDKNGLAWKVVEERRSIRIADVQDPSDEYRNQLDSVSLGRMREGFFGEGARLRSWLCVPVMSGRLTLGVIKLITSDHGRFLGPHDQEVVESVASRLAWEVRKASSRAMGEDLDRLVGDLADTVGAELGPLLLEKLGAWVDRYIRPSCVLAIFVRSSPDRSLLTVASPELGTDITDKLEALSRQLGARGQEWQKSGVVKIGEDNWSTPSAGIAAPIVLPALTDLEGHFFVLHSRKFVPEQANIAQQAARALAVLLNAERIRQTMSLGAAFFRHSLLGALQGLSDAALMLTEDPTEEERGRAVTQIHLETENIRFWSATQRFTRFDRPGELEIRKRPWPLKRIFETCVGRYRKIMEGRGIRLVEDWREKGSVEFSFDVETLDLALSNLLHNAVKYAFYNREVIVGAQVHGDMVQIWVEDVGHSLPDKLFQQGQRFVKDPLRAIPGEGLGLYMVRRVLEAHSGRLTHSCERERYSPKESLPPNFSMDKVPYRVRFTMEIPHGWHRKR
jgi:GAF domain-containing protein